MARSFGAVVIGTPDPAGTAAFYRELLGWLTVEGDDPDFIRLRDPGRERPGLSFQRESGFIAPTWPPQPGAQQLQAHLDVLVDDLDAEVARALALGACRDDHQPAEGVVIMRDPWGGVFCLFLDGY
ncbi:VOC family protein [Actinomycetospora endophytica]|uniref:VOC family protein n=1 Tax=Actinomycetospora endophytica TaxID=2291215 RepID=A0ABS8PFI3_9PSEU|nr:VOC family protein [Actinomycetospora endophytica]MCD2196768.1 VOC family protein [Actinomycetospora endophytica]